MVYESAAGLGGKHHLHRSAYAILRAMKCGPRSRGFTIVEVLIVLGVSSLIFAAVAVTLTGRQNRTEFDQSIQDVQSRIQQIVNNVGAGYYANNGHFQCNASSTVSPTPPSISAGVNNQGANQGCVFMGDVVQFGATDTVPPGQSRVFTVVGRQWQGAETVNADSVVPTSYTQAAPIAIAKTSAGDPTPDGTTIMPLLYGLQLVKAYYGPSTSPTAISGVAFLSSLTGYGSGNALISGSQQVVAVPISTGGVSGTDKYTMANAINSDLATNADEVVSSTSNSLQQAMEQYGVSLCFASTGSDQSGLITIGSNGHALSVTLSVMDDTTCT